MLYTTLWSVNINLLSNTVNCIQNSIFHAVSCIDNLVLEWCELGKSITKNHPPLSPVRKPISSFCKLSTVYMTLSPHSLATLTVNCLHDSISPQFGYSGYLSPTFQHRGRMPQRRSMVQWTVQRAVCIV